MTQVFITHIGRIIKLGSVLWNTRYIGELHLLESVQRPTKWTGLRIFHSLRVSTMNLFSVKGRLIHADLLIVGKIMNDLTLI